MYSIVLKILQVFYTVDKPSTDWRGGVGFVSKDMVLKGLPGPAEDSLILVILNESMIYHVELFLLYIFVFNKVSLINFVNVNLFPYVTV
jgi:NAD(P)H-flavin reductase